MFTARIPLLVVCAVLALLAGGSVGSTSGVDVSYVGDFNCDQQVDIQDTLAPIRAEAGVSPLAGCAAGASLQCDGQSNLADALSLLQKQAGIRVSPAPGCSPIDMLPPGVPQADAAAALANRLADPPTLVTAIDAVQDALRHAGVASGLDEDVFVPALEPEASEIAQPDQWLMLAMEARTGVSRMNADEIGQMFSDFGWQFADGSTPGQQITSMVATMVDEAQASPDDEEAFGPLLIGELALHHEPPLDLTKPGLDPTEVRLNLLELELLSATFDRGSTKPAATQAIAEPAGLPEVCSQVKKAIAGKIGPYGGATVGLGLKKAGPGLVKNGLAAAGVSTASISNVSNALGILSTIAKIWKMIEFYSSAQIDVRLQGDPTAHKPLDTELSDLREFRGTAGVSEKDWKEYLDSFELLSLDTHRALKDCLTTIGFPPLTDLGDIAKDTANWKIEWTIYNDEVNSRNEPTVTWRINQQFGPGNEHYSKWQSNLRPVSDFEAQASFVVQLGTERASDHPGHPRSNDVLVCGDLLSAQPPDIGVFIKAAKGILGLIDSLVNLGAIWLQSVWTPEACARFLVTWHEPTCPAAVSASDAIPQGAPVLAEGSVSLNPASMTSIEELPCQWTGTATAETNYSQLSWEDEVGHVDANFTFGNLRIEHGPNPSCASICAEYDVIGGAAKWKVTGHANCPEGWREFSYNGTNEVGGFLRVEPDPDAGALRYYFAGHILGQDQDICFQGQAGLTLPAGAWPIFYTTEWGHACEELPLADQNSGTCTYDNPGVWHDTYQWSFGTAGCAAAAGDVVAEGVCGGAMSARR